MEHPDPLGIGVLFIRVVALFEVTDMCLHANQAFLSILYMLSRVSIPLIAFEDIIINHLLSKVQSMKSDFTVATDEYI